MKYDKRFKIAIKESIEHWRKDILAPLLTGQVVSITAASAKYCALCKACTLEDNRRYCSLCPVFRTSNQGNCNGTPYNEATGAICNYEERPTTDNLEKAIKRVQKEIDFLKLVAYQTEYENE